MPRFNQTPRVQQGLKAIRLALGALQNLSIAQMLSAAAMQYGLDPGLVMAVAQRESGLNPNIVNSSSGASGVMQLMPATAASLGVTNIFDPLQNINAGVRYLAQLIQQFGGDVVKGVAAYDWGPGHLTSAVSQYGSDWLSAAPGETQAYVAAILGVTPGPPPTPAPPGPPLTIDATTGLPVYDTTDVSQLPPVNAPSGATAGNVLLLTGLGIGVFLLADVIRDW